MKTNCICALSQLFSRQMNNMLSIQNEEHKVALKILLTRIVKHSHL
jgi:hypothetical protein